MVLRRIFGPKREEDGENYTVRSFIIGTLAKKIIRLRWICLTESRVYMVEMRSA
jgi:hypothetical protein